MEKSLFSALSVDFCACLLMNSWHRRLLLGPFREVMHLFPVLYISQDIGVVIHGNAPVNSFMLQMETYRSLLDME